MKTPLIIFLVIITTFTSCKKENNFIKPRYEISVNESLQIRLGSNASTGYSWQWTNKQSVDIVDTSGCTYIPDNPISFGSGGIELWKFKGIKKGKTTVKLEYGRPWDANSIVETKEIVIKVK